ncbi:MAG TPA: nucleotidyl transferase AbiEii/AbiGii toxin family protein, partial [Verrucomicrobiota bacterium]|nr:nucleotidyl transferase AbiEii/AbiGii toxin family protein [Verrucomicrobiota bacterium]
GTSRRALAVLPPETERVWSFVREQPSLAGFVLVGGTALALHLGHRRSEDLDLVWTGIRLPRVGLDQFTRAAAEAGVPFTPHDDPAALEEFAFGGGDLRDHQQDFLAAGVVKVSFFTADAALARVLRPGVPTGVRVADLDELFKAKALVSASRSRTRDWLDLYLLLRSGRFSLRDFRSAFHEAGIPQACDTALGRLCGGVPSRGDEGFEHLLPDPPSLAQMSEFFRAERDALQIQLAQEAAAGRAKP